jgi:hypothetical protein
VRQARLSISAGIERFEVGIQGEHPARFADYFFPLARRQLLWHLDNESITLAVKAQ